MLGYSTVTPKALRISHSSFTTCWLNRQDNNKKNLKNGKKAELYYPIVLCFKKLYYIVVKLDTLGARS